MQRKNPGTDQESGIRMANRSSPRPEESGRVCLPGHRRHPSQQQRALRAVLGSLLTIGLLLTLGPGLARRLSAHEQPRSSAPAVHVAPIPCHSHNDYWREQPLLSALKAGCVSVEADVWAFDGELYVGHSRGSLTPDRTFTATYVDPLVRILGNPSSPASPETVPHGVYELDHNQTLVLLVDLKTDGLATWPLLLDKLAPLRLQGWLRSASKGEVFPGPVTVVGTGDTPFRMLAAGGDSRDAFFDAPLASLGSEPIPTRPARL